MSANDVPLTGLPLAVAEVCEAIGLEVHRAPAFAPNAPVMVYGPLDSIAILLDLLMYEDQQESSGDLLKKFDSEQEM